MALNFPGPYQLRLFYTVATRNHVLNLNFKSSLSINPGDAFSTIFPDNRNGSNAISLATHVTNLLGGIDNLFNSADADFYLGEVWSFTPGTFDATFVTAETIAVSGAAVTATVPATQYIITLRTAEGGVMKVYLHDIAQPHSATVRPPLGVGTQAIVDEFIGDTKPWLARDTSYPIGIIGVHPGQSEHWFKEIYR